MYTLLMKVQNVIQIKVYSGLQNTTEEWVNIIHVIGKNLSVIPFCFCLLIIQFFFFFLWIQMEALEKAEQTSPPC